MAIYPTGASSDADLYIASDNFSTTLSIAIDNVQTTISVNSVVGLPTVGILTIESEKVKYTGISGNDLTGCTRGFSSTSAASHALGATVVFNIVEEHHNVLKDEIKAIETDLIAIKAALNDADTPASTASDVKDRLDQVVSEIKLITGNANWYDVVAKNLTQLLPLSGGTLTGNLVLPVGSAALPSLTFTGDTDTGIYSAGANSLTITSGGSYIAQFLSGQARFIDGTAAAPSICFDLDSDTGFYRGASNTIAASCGGSATMNIATSYIWTMTNQHFFQVGSAAVPSISFQADTNTGIYSYGADQIGIASNGGLATIFTRTQILQENGTSSLPGFSFQNDPDTGIYRYSTNQVGIACGGSLILVVGGSGGTVLAAAAGAFNCNTILPNSSGVDNLGNASTYWNDISYKTLTDRGCLPWCDDGVELSDGRIVTDLEALCAIEKHPTEITVQGLPKLDYSTFPKKAYKPAEIDGVLLPRNEDDLPIGGADGVEMTMVFGVMIGAFKELKGKFDALEARLAALETPQE